MMSGGGGGGGKVGFNCCWDCLTSSCSPLSDGSGCDERDALLQNHASLKIEVGGRWLVVWRGLSGQKRRSSRSRSVQDSDLIL